MVKGRRIRYDVPFVLFLILAWVGITNIAAVAFWNTADRSWQEGMPWLSLWVFAVLTPTIAAFRLHRRLNDLVATVPEIPERIVHDLANMRWLFLMFGSMTALSAMSLILR
jgi:hypothetical protein